MEIAKRPRAAKTPALTAEDRQLPRALKKASQLNGPGSPFTVQKASAHNMKRTWVLPASGAMPAMDEMLREAAS